LLDSTIHWLVDQDYTVVPVEASGWTTEADLHRDLAAALDFPGYYGHNLDALNDCLRDLASFRCGHNMKTLGRGPGRLTYPTAGSGAAASGFVLVLIGYDHFAERFPRDAQIVLNIFAERARTALLIGHRMMCLIQSDNPAICFDPVGAMDVEWTEPEWNSSTRGLVE
jgi:hypothetical protein